MNTDKHGLKRAAERSASTIPSVVLSEPKLTKREKAAWLYPISESAGWHFSLPSGKWLDVSTKNFEKLVRDKSLTTGDRTWPLSTNFKNVNEGDDLFVYTGDHDRGIIGYASIKSVDRKKRAIVLSFDRTKCLQLLQKPVSALVIRQWLWPRAAVADLTPYLAELKSSLPWTETI